MKIAFQCGATIYDQTDQLPQKAHFVRDEDWFDVLDSIDDAIERSGPTAKEKEAACMKVRRLIGNLARSAWQCRACGRVYIDDQEHELREFVPGSTEVPREIFRSRPLSEPGTDRNVHPTGNA
jgi:hypothetical protein